MDFCQLNAQDGLEGILLPGSPGLLVAQACEVRCDGELSAGPAAGLSGETPAAQPAWMQQLPVPE